MSVTYSLAVDHWRNTESIVIRSRSGKHIASFPLDFIQRGGDNTWRFVLYVIKQLVKQSTDAEGIIEGSKGIQVDQDDMPRGGNFSFVQSGQSNLLPLKRVSVR